MALKMEQIIERLEALEEEVFGDVSDETPENETQTGTALPQTVKSGTGFSSSASEPVA